MEAARPVDERILWPNIDREEGGLIFVSLTDAASPSGVFIAGNNQKAPLLYHLLHG